MTPSPFRRPIQTRVLPGALAVVLALAGCGELVTAPPADAPTVEARADAIVAGTPVPLRLHNPTSVTWTYAACPGAFQRYVEGAWVDVPPAFLLCAAEVTVISPGETIDVEVFVATEAAAGTYRAVVPFANGGELVNGRSGVFEVEAQPIGDAPVVSVLEASVTRGDNATVRLLNPTTLAFGFNLCSDGRWQRLVGDTWVDTAEPIWLCTAALKPLAAGAFDDETYPVFADLAPGTYRIRVRLWREFADAITRYSNTVVVN